MAPRRKAASPEPAKATPVRQSTRKRPAAKIEEPSNEADNDKAAQASPAKRPRGRPTAVSKLQNGASQKKSIYDVPSDDDDAVGVGGSNKDKAETHVGDEEEEAAATTPKRKLKTSASPVKASAGKNITTPSRATRFTNGETPQWRRNDRSARKKSAMALIERVVAGDASDEDEQEELAQEIYNSSQDEDEEEEELEEGVEGKTQEVDESKAAAASPSKKPRGRQKKDKEPKQKGRTCKKSPTPPRDLPPYELYFAQNRPGAAKTSSNTLASLELLTHEEYFSILHQHKEHHAGDIEYLQSWHTENFAQWPLLHKFAKFLYDETPDHESSKIVIINGYVRSTSIREMLGTIASAVEPSHRLPAGNPSVMLESLKALLSSHDINITIIINSIDAVPLRRAGTQTILAQLASHPQIQLICSADTPDFSLLWDSGVRSAFDFVFHDCTTFAPFTVEIDVVDDVHELLGRKARRVGGKEGVTYVLRSLPENAKNLFRLLVTEVLMAIDEEGMSGGENPGVEYRILYNKAVEEFICSSEMAFRTLLKEFHDHQMITSRKDVLGTELLSLPFRREELEAILEDLMA
ncbi:origin recognition complex subunit 2-domain-containing protein [Apiospora phragmitis]|uniref:Origin recognition complex subunit 2 n=1 Tax=Apiospora phragmitis TaxID=2905665 RepID=A0ABR1W6J4_9PEZI